MSEKYKHAILLLISNSTDVEYLAAVYSFALNYPDSSSKGFESAKQNIST